jgi:hypothetical protein
MLCFRSTVSEVVLWLLYYIISQLLEKIAKKQRIFSISICRFWGKISGWASPLDLHIPQQRIIGLHNLYMLMVKAFFSAF